MNNLYTACELGDLETIIYSYHKGEFDEIREYGIHALELAVAKGQLYSVHYLLYNMYRDIIIRFPERLPDIMIRPYVRIAVINDQVRIVKYFKSWGFDIHCFNEMLFLISTSNGALRVTKFLVENGADIHTSNDYALRYSAGKNLLEIVQYLVSQGADIHAVNDEAMNRATLYDHEEIIDYFKSLDPKYYESFESNLDDVFSCF